VHIHVGKKIHPSRGMNFMLDMLIVHYVSDLSNLVRDKLNSCFLSTRNSL